MSLLINDFSQNENINNFNKGTLEDDIKSRISTNSPPHSVRSKSSSNSLKAFIGLLSVTNEIPKQTQQKKKTLINIKFNPNIPTNLKTKFNELVTKTKPFSHRTKGSHAIINKVQQMKNQMQKDNFVTLNNVSSHIHSYSNTLNSFPRKDKRTLISLKSKQIEEAKDIEEFKNELDYSSQKRNLFGLRDFERKFKTRSFQRDKKYSNTICVKNNNNSNIYNNTWLNQNMYYLNTQQGSIYHKTQL